jgi:HAD superfamily hydrolase (TIGR01509 family)
MFTISNSIGSCSLVPVSYPQQLKKITGTGGNQNAMVIKKPKVIIFDFWGTLVEQGVYSPIKQVKRLLRLYDMAYPEFVVRFERAMMTTQFGSLKDGFVAVCEEFGVRAHPQLIEELIGMWNKNWLFAKLYPDSITTLQRLNKNYDLVLIANTDNFSVDGVLDKFDLARYFKFIFLSYKEGYIKTDPEMYARILEKVEVPAEDCVAVGDSLHSDVAAAQQVGVDAILVDRRGQREFEQKITTLAELPWK